MYKNHKISVSIPAFNEEKLIATTVKSMPDYIDYIIAVNDASKDETIDILNTIKSPKLIIIDSKINGGVGASILKGHAKGVEKGADIMVVMAGDNQMDPAYLPALLDEIIENKIDYVKGNRFGHLSELKSMPKMRLVGNIVTTILTKIASGYWSSSDPLNGYTALRSSSYKSLNHKKLNGRYGFELSMLIELSFIKAKVKDVFIPAKYGKEVSSIKIFRDTKLALKVLSRGFLRRIFYQHILFNFTAVGLLLILGNSLIGFGLLLGIYLLIYSFGSNVASTATVMLSVTPIILGVQFILQAVQIDIQNEPKVS